MNKSENIVKQITNKISIIALIIGIILFICFVFNFGHKHSIISNIKNYNQDKWKNSCEEYHLCIEDETNTEDFCRFMYSGCNYNEVKEHYDKKYGYLIFLFIGSIGSFIVAFIFHTKKKKI